MERGFYLQISYKQFRVQVSYDTPFASCKSCIAVTLTCGPESQGHIWFPLVENVVAAHIGIDSVMKEHLPYDIEL